MGHGAGKGLLSPLDLQAELDVAQIIVPFALVMYRSQRRGEWAQADARNGDLAGGAPSPGHCQQAAGKTERATESPCRPHTHLRPTSKRARNEFAVLLAREP